MENTRAVRRDDSPPRRERTRCLTANKFKIEFQQGLTSTTNQLRFAYKGGAAMKLGQCWGMRGAGNARGHFSRLGWAVVYELVVVHAGAGLGRKAHGEQHAVMPVLSRNTYIHIYNRWEYPENILTIFNCLSLTSSS